MMEICPPPGGWRRRRRSSNLSYSKSLPFLLHPFFSLSLSLSCTESKESAAVPRAREKQKEMGLRLQQQPAQEGRRRTSQKVGLFHISSFPLSLSLSRARGERERENFLFPPSRRRPEGQKLPDFHPPSPQTELRKTTITYPGTSPRGHPGDTRARTGAAAAEGES